MAKIHTCINQNIYRLNKQSWYRKGLILIVLTPLFLKGVGEVNFDYHSWKGIWKIRKRVWKHGAGAGLQGEGACGRGASDTFSI